MNDEKGTVGSTLDDFLVEDGSYETVAAESMKRVVAWQVSQVMEERGLDGNGMAALLNMERAKLDRVLDPSHTGMTLRTLCGIAEALGKRVTLVFEDRDVA